MYRQQAVVTRGVQARFVLYATPVSALSPRRAPAPAALAVPGFWHGSGTACLTTPSPNS